VPYLAAVASIGGRVYTYLYTEGGVWHQVARDRQYMSNNFAAPTGRIRAELLARTLQAAEKGEPLVQD